jgi:hypothetical protein
MTNLTTNKGKSNLDFPYEYLNGNLHIKLESNGSRTIGCFEDKLVPNYPLNIDIRVSTSCSFANTLCKNFCHESAVVKGKDCDYEVLKSKLRGLPKGIELAIGCNKLTIELYKFLEWCNEQEYVANLTINQGHLSRDLAMLLLAIDNNLVQGIGISYRSELPFNIPKQLLEYEHVVFNVIIGIDNFNDVTNLSTKGVKRLVVLGMKDFGNYLNKADYSNNNLQYKEWIWNISKWFGNDAPFDNISFDNLAVEQLQMKRLLSTEQYNSFYNYEFSMYIDAANQIYRPSSRDSNFVEWNTSALEYFQSLNK